MSRSSISSALVVGLSILISACGASSNDASEKAPTKAEFIKRADLICKQADQLQDDALKAFLAEGRRGERGQSVEEQIVLVVGLPPLRIETRKLEALTPPEGDQEQVEAIVASLKKAIAKGEEDPGTMVADSLGPFEEAGRLAREYGLKVCAFPI